MLGSKFVFCMTCIVFMQNGEEDVTHHVKPQPLIPDATTDTNRHLENVTSQLAALGSDLIYSQNYLLTVYSN